MGHTKKLKKKELKKEHKKRRRHDSDIYSEDEVADNKTPKKKHKKEKKRKFRKPKRRQSTSSENSSNYGDMNEILKTPPKHQKVKRIMYRRKIRNIDPDMFVSLKKFAYDKEKMIQQAFLTLRRGLIERICPQELSHLTMDELKQKLVTLACTMSKERLRTYADDEDLSHSSDSFEPDTPTDLSESDLEIVDDQDLVDALFEQKAQAVEQENELRERLARKVLLSRMKSKTQEVVPKEEPGIPEFKVKKQDLEDGEVLSDGDHHVSNIPLPPSSPQPIAISDDEDDNSRSSNIFINGIIIPPPPPPPPLPTPPVKPTIVLHYDDDDPVDTLLIPNDSIVRLVATKSDSLKPDETSTSNTSLPLELKEQLSTLEKHLLCTVDSADEIDYDEDGIGSEPELDDL